MPTSYCDVKEAADHARCSTRTIQRLLRDGSLQRYRVGRAVRIDRDELERFMATSGLGLTPAQSLAAYVSGLADDAPELTPEQRQRIASLLRGEPAARQEVADDAA